jgi:nucleoside-diphosphate-sugar epimerase
MGREKENADMAKILMKISEERFRNTGAQYNFVGSHSILQLMAIGHQVRTTVRSLKRKGEVRATLKEGGAVPGDRLSFIAADLENDEVWTEAVAGCEYVLHVASRLPLNIPKNEDELIVPAREGALRVLRASRKVGVKRVVLTSSFAAVGYGQMSKIAPSTRRIGRIPMGTSSLREIENVGRTSGLGFHYHRRRLSRTCGCQSGGRVRSGPGA